MKTVMIVAGESSGELYGSLLAKELKSKWPELRIIGVGGERMDKAGVELISGISGAFGLVEVISAFRKVRSAFRRTLQAIKSILPDVLVLIDYPDFNIKVAKTAKSSGIKILYYVSPQVWAWRKGRVRKIGALVDKMAVVLPFEEEIYRKAGVTCEFVGHPILEEIESVLQLTNAPNPPLIPPLIRGDIGGSKGGGGGFESSLFKASLGFDPDKPLLSLLPGSRHHELCRLLPLVLDIVRQFKNDPEIKFKKGYQFCVPLAPNTDENKYSLYIESLKKEGVAITKGESVRALAASDIAVVASGTATLQAALLGVPMVVIYKLSPLTYWLGRLVVNVKYISLVNLLSGKGVVTELLQQRANPEDTISEIKKIIFDSFYKDRILDHYNSIRASFSGRKASRRVAEIIGEMAGWKR
ncbi:MAG: hypothetical protein AB1638_01400 [Nitrospirota bacterium]